jgi:hypothetical protein
MPNPLQLNFPSMQGNGLSSTTPSNRNLPPPHISAERNVVTGTINVFHFLQTGLTYVGLETMDMNLSGRVEILNTLKETQSRSSAAINGNTRRLRENMQDAVIDFLNNPHFQGAAQAFGGLGEASAGGYITLQTGLIAAPLGWPLMAHGIDHFITGIRVFISGNPSHSTTTELLHKAGVPLTLAAEIDVGAAMIATLGATSLSRISRAAAPPIFRLSAAPSEINSSVNEPIRWTPTFTDAAGKHMYEVGRRIPVHILDNMIKSPIAVVKDPRGASNALMHYSQIWKNGRLYNAEVLYDKTTNTILHFQYTQKPIGPLKKVSK